MTQCHIDTKSTKHSEKNPTTREREGERATTITSVTTATISSRPSGVGIARVSSPKYGINPGVGVSCI